MKHCVNIADNSITKTKVSQVQLGRRFERRVYGAQNIASDQTPYFIHWKAVSITTTTPDITDTVNTDFNVTKSSPKRRRHEINSLSISFATCHMTSILDSGILFCGLSIFI